MVAGICGCRRATVVESSVVDDLGRSVILNADPKRVVTLAPSLTEIVMAAGGTDRLVAVSNADNLPETETLGKVSALPVDFESILSHRPDLVFMLAGLNRIEDADRLADLGIPTFFVAVNSLDDVFADIRTVGRVLGTATAADQQASLLQEALHSITNMVPSSAARPRVLFLIGDKDLYSFGAGSYIHDVIAKAGGESITETIDQENALLSEEYVLTANPEVIVVAMGDEYNVNDLSANHPSWSTLSAIVNNRVVSIDPDIALRAGPRLVNAVTILVSRLHPEVLENADSGVLVLE